jgi:hypothetical protein
MLEFDSGDESEPEQDEWQRSFGLNGGKLEKREVCKDKPLQWWQEHHNEYPILS